MEEEQVGNKSMIDFKEMDGNRVKLITLNREYIEDIHEYSVLPEFYRYLEYPPFKKIKETEIFFEKLCKRSNGQTCHYWLIFLKDKKKVIGTFGLHDIDWRRGNGELTYGLSPKFWGKGFFSESLKLILGWAFTNNRFHRLFIKTEAQNRASIIAAKKLGFQHEGVMREFYLDEKSNERQDAVTLSMLKTDYKIHNTSV